MLEGVLLDVDYTLVRVITKWYVEHYDIDPRILRGTVTDWKGIEHTMLVRYGLKDFLSKLLKSGLHVGICTADGVNNTLIKMKCLLELGVIDEEIFDELQWNTWTNGDMVHGKKDLESVRNKWGVDNIILVDDNSDIVVPPTEVINTINIRPFNSEIDNELDRVYNLIMHRFQGK
jgi:hypothetical protein